MAEVGSLVSDEGWTHQGRAYLEEMGWAIRLTPQELDELTAPAQSAVEPKPVAKKVPAKKAPVKKTVAKKTVAKTVKKPVKK